MSRSTHIRVVLCCFRVLTWVETLLCPHGQHEKVLDYSLQELDYATRPDPIRRYAADTFQHLRRHGVVPLSGAVLVGIGTALYSLVNASIPQDILWPVAGIGLIFGLPVIIPKVDAVRGGCPYLLDQRPPAAVPLRTRTLRTAVVGVLISLTAFAMPIRHPVFDVASLIGVLVSGVGIMLLAVASYRSSANILVLALRVTALGALLVGFGDGGWGLIGASRSADVIASTVTGIGGVIYALSISSLIYCFKPSPEVPDEPSVVRADPTSQNIDERAA